MKGASAVAALLATLVLPGAVGAQGIMAENPLEPEALRAYESVIASVVRLRTSADVELELTDPESGLRSVVKRPLSVQGSGVVIGEVSVNGRTEYLIVTNHHVADPTNYVVQEGHFLKENRHNTRAEPLVPETTFLTLSEGGEESSSDIRLIEVSRDVQGDMTLMRTVGATRRLPVFNGQLGFHPGDLIEGMPVITSGYPNGGRRITDVGHIMEIDRKHELGPPHHDIVLTLEVEHGQSGSPVFVAQKQGDHTEFVLIGLLHARERGISYMVPTTLWQHALGVDAGRVESAEAAIARIRE